MKRSGPPARRKGLGSGARSPGSAPQRPRALRSRSPAAAGRQASRVALVRELVAAGVRCEIGHVVAAAGIAPFRCTGRIGGIHERRKRSSSGSVSIGRNLIPACNWCNGWVEDNAGPARDLFGSWLVLREGDPEWEALGIRSEGPPIVVHTCSQCGEPFTCLGPEGGRMVAPCGHDG